MTSENSLSNTSPNRECVLLPVQALPLLGHLHPPFLHIMDEIQQGLRYLFQTTSPYTLVVAGTGAFVLF